MNGMNCIRCGQPLDPGAAFCGNCGQPVAQAAAQPPAQTPPPMPVAAATPAVQPVAVVPAAPQPPQPPVQPVVAQPVSQIPAQQVSQPVAGVTPAQPAAVPQGQPPVAAGVPAYAVSPPAQPGEVKAIIGLIAGVLAIPGALIPIIGLSLSTVCLVLASLSLRTKRKMAKISFALGCLGVLLSLAGFAYNVQHLSQTRLGSATQAISTPCYDVKLNTSLHITNTSGSCTTTAYLGDSADTAVQAYLLDGSTEADVTDANFAQISQQAASTIVTTMSDAHRTFQITSENNGTFGGEKAYFINVSTPDGAHGRIALVLHHAPNGNNVFVVYAVNSSGGVDLASIESHLVWK